MGTVHEDQCIFLIAHSVLLRIRYVSDKTWEKIKTHTLCSVTLFQTSCHLWHNVEKFSKGREATDNNTVQAHFTLGTQGYKLSLSEYVIQITNSCSTARIVAWILHYMYTACLVSCTLCPFYNNFYLFTLILMINWSHTVRHDTNTCFQKLT